MFFFRADGNEKIGAGHIMRCLSIASMTLAMGHEVYFYTAGEEFSDVIRDRHINNIVIHSDFMQMESELVFFKGEIASKGPKYIFVDSYFVTKGYLIELKREANLYGGKLIYIDDVMAFAYPCDYLINYNIYATNMQDRYRQLYLSEDIDMPTFLLGMKYVPIRKEFTNLSSREVRQRPRDILVSTGGADTEHMALAIVRYLLGLPKSKIDDFRFHILIGAMNRDKQEIETLASGFDNIQIHYNVKNMVSLMQECDAAISAAGSTLYELCATQTPTITYVLADNQVLGAKGFEEAGLMEYAGDVREIGVENTAGNLVNRSISLVADTTSMTRKIAKMIETRFEGAISILNTLLS